jgi:hypothetical protein
MIGYIIIVLLGIINIDYESWLGKRKKVDFGLS